MPHAATASGADAAAPGEPVGPLERGLAVLRALAAHPGPRMRPGDLARATGLARSTVDRIVTTLTRLGYLRIEDGRDVVLAPRLMELGNAYLACCGLPDTLEPFAVALADELDESVSLAVPDNAGVRFISQSTRRRTMALAFQIGDLLPAERCAPGVLFAADWSPEQRAAWRTRLHDDPCDLGFPAVPPRPVPPAPDAVEAAFRQREADARNAGWAVDDQLIEPGLVAVAVPVHASDGSTVCALSVVSHTSRHSAGSLAEHALPRLRACAARMEAALESPVPAAARTAPGGPDRSRAPKEELGPEFLQSLARGLAVLTALGSAPGGLTLSGAAEATGLPRATARRALLSLQQLGYAAPAGDGRRFTLLPTVLELGYARLSRLAFAEIAQPHLARLVEQVHDSASVAVLADDDIMYVARVHTVRIMSVSITVGTRFPAYATSMGRVLLAGLPEQEAAARLARAPVRRLTPFTRVGAAELAEAVAQARRDGHALVDQELEEGLRSIAVPVHDRAGQVVAAVNVSTHASRGTPDDVRRALLPALADAAAAIEEDLAVVTERVGLPIP
ncbi:helix-turn-helix domain-containing protein [Streptomyces sp. JH14]|uniref:IclR family transcriptional regulator domain-containing protein n=1 Tax=Streptomyces sp. JH14 TaxID=2793630 RepID=UPI0023F6F2FE|nr:IclR family transcriptional regulator C-terminal domain-containing protein [Streptomyces sp. JH14]MDF6044681.1 helix-turn-helix domain-containing protein [Streptomyces sp. JH14]